jgi:hypothetical protein
MTTTTDAERDEPCVVDRRRFLRTRLRSTPTDDRPRRPTPPGDARSRGIVSKRKVSPAGLGVCRHVRQPLDEFTFGAIDFMVKNSRRGTARSRHAREFPTSSGPPVATTLTASDDVNHRGREFLQQSTKVRDHHDAAVPLCCRQLQSTRHGAQRIDVEARVNFVEHREFWTKNSDLHHFGAFTLAAREVEFTKRSRTSGRSSTLRLRRSCAHEDSSGRHPPRPKDQWDAHPELPWVAAGPTVARGARAASARVQKFDVIENHRSVEDLVAGVTRPARAPGSTYPIRWVP